MGAYELVMTYKIWWLRIAVVPPERQSAREWKSIRPRMGVDPPEEQTVHKITKMTLLLRFFVLFVFFF